MDFLAGILIIIVSLTLVKTFLDLFVFRTSVKMSHVRSRANSTQAVRQETTPRVTAHNLRYLEKRMLNLVNAERKRHQLEARFARPLEWDEATAGVAKMHSIDMARRNYMGHVSPDGRDPAARLQEGRVEFTAAGENVARGYRTVEDTMFAFMDQPRFIQNHRSNILNPVYNHVGVGIILDPNGGLLVTQNFIRR